MLDVAVIIVSWNVRDYLIDCLESLAAEIDRSSLVVEVWVVDNGSTDGTVKLLMDRFPNVHLVRNENNPGFGAANNDGMRAASQHEPRYLFLLNPDTVTGERALSSLVSFLEACPQAAMAGARLTYGDGGFQHSAFRFPGLAQLAFELFPMPSRLYESRLNGRYPRLWYSSGSEPFAIDHPLGAAMLVRTEVFRSIGGFDESYHMYCEEIDWCMRIRSAGWQIYTVPAAEIVHFGGESTKQVQARSLLNLWRSRAQLYRRHVGRFEFLLATWLVRLGMNRKSAGTSDPELKSTYQKIAAFWRAGHGD
jgi:N-acetylglucosaminyl-diphospho-decaprenol L-rhamnosyltransferase